MKERSGMPYDVVAFSTDELAVLLSNTQEGMFHRMMRHSWVNGSLPADEVALSSIARESLDVFRMHWTFPLKDMWVAHPRLANRLINKKQEHERKYKKSISDAAITANKVRWDAERKRKASGVRPDKPPESDRSPSHPFPSPSIPKGIEGEENATAPPVLQLGEFKHVELTPSEVEKLQLRLNGSFDRYLSDLDLYGETHPAKFRKYKNHCAVILSWYGRDVKDGKVKPANSEPKKVWKPSEYL